MNDALTSDHALERLKYRLLESDQMFGALLRTTQAVDLVSGGMKANALPVIAEAIVNHRIAEDRQVLCRTFL